MLVTMSAPSVALRAAEKIARIDFVPFTVGLAACERRRLFCRREFWRVFDETLQGDSLTESDQSVLYRELLEWAKKSKELFQLLTKVIHRENRVKSAKSLALARIPGPPTPFGEAN